MCVATDQSAPLPRPDTSDLTNPYLPAHPTAFRGNPRPPTAWRAPVLTGRQNTFAGRLVPCGEEARAGSLRACGLVGERRAQKSGRSSHSGYGSSAPSENRAGINSFVVTLGLELVDQGCSHRNRRRAGGELSSGIRSGAAVAITLPNGACSGQPCCRRRIRAGSASSRQGAGMARSDIADVYHLPTSDEEERGVIVVGKLPR